MIRLMYFALGSAVGSFMMLAFIVSRLQSLEAASFELAASSYYKACVEATGENCREKAQAFMEQLESLKIE